jgi:hypothetical protein
LRTSCGTIGAGADVEQLVGLLFVAAEPLRRSEITETLRIRPLGDFTPLLHR